MAKRSVKQRPGSPPAQRRMWLLLGAGAATIIVGTAAVLDVAYAGKVSPGVRFADISLGGRTAAEAEAVIRAGLSKAQGEGIKLVFKDKELVLEYAVADTKNLGLASDVVSYNADATVRQMRTFGRDGSPLVRALARLQALVAGAQVTPAVTIDANGLNRALTGTLGSYEDPAVEPSFLLTGKQVSMKPPKAGTAFDYPAISREVERRIRTLAAEPVTVSLQEDVPLVSASEAESLLPEVRQRVDDGAVTLEADGQPVTLKLATFVTWLRPVRENGQLSLVVDGAAVEAYLTELLPQVSTVAKNAKFALNDGVVTQIQGSSMGRELDIEASVLVIRRALERGESSVALVMREVQPEATAETIGNLGVKELVAVGRTNFSGSPVNRRHNIKVGADLLNGLLVRPGDEFSLVKAIGPVDATLGYRQELVIKENRTIPEFGGGLCQIGTTFFRLVLNAGLPVVERKNHSYRVRYYEPPVGMDATIYEPKPDFRFKNDYPTYLLLQTRIEGDDLVFEFWGTKDGRVASSSTPKVYNVVAPPPPLKIETTEIPVGTTKCIEKAHPGSDADFTYSVTYGDGQKVDTKFTSHYRPWREICLVGVKDLPKDTDEEEG
ncbi:MAG: VanW family protein [Candidatus Kerfeldbacteria bacterium]|nr:VanW family protein [Candidatus Kerfeldbacteria bacterium]